MENKKLKLVEINVGSFITNINGKTTLTIKGGATAADCINFSYALASGTGGLGLACQMIAVADAGMEVSQAICGTLINGCFNTGTTSGIGNTTQGENAQSDYNMFCSRTNCASYANIEE